MPSIGEYIKMLREQKNYSQRKLSYVSHVSNATINRIESNITLPTPDTLKKLSGPLGTTYEELMDMAGYLNRGSWVSDNVRQLREKKKMTYSQLAKDIKVVTGEEISPEILESMEKGSEARASVSYINALAKYKGANSELFFRDGLPGYSDTSGGAAQTSQRAEEAVLSHIEDEELRKWVKSPESIDYIILAKKVYDMGIDPDFVYNNFISKIFRKGSD